MSTLLFVGQFIASKVGATGLTVTVDVDRYTLADGTRTVLVTGGAATEGRRGLYHYRLANADLSQYQYVCTFVTAGTADQQEVAAIGLVLPDELVSSRLATAGYTAPDNVAVGAIKAQTDKLAFTGTDVKATLDGETVTAASVTDKTGYALTAAYDAAKAAASQASVDALPDATWNALSTAATYQEDSFGNVLNDLTEEAGGLYRFTSSALAQASGGATAEEVAAALLVTPANKLLTDAAGRIEVSGTSKNTLPELEAALLATLPGEVWANTERTLTTPAAQAAVPAVDGPALTLTLTASFAATLTGLTIPATWTRLWFTLKRAAGDSDAASKLQVVISNPEALTDGVRYLASEAATASQRELGALIVNQAGGSVGIDLAPALTALIGAGTGLVWDLKCLQADGAASVLAAGTATCAWAVTREHN